jgi:hypothetical protein
MKKGYLILMLGALFFNKNVTAQSSIQPNFGFNIWKISGLDMLSYLEVGAVYEHSLNDNLGLNAGFSYNFSQGSSLNSGFIQLSAGGRYNFNELNDGAFVGAGLGYGFIDGGNYLEFGANFGYSLPLGPGSLNPSIGLGYLSVGSSGFRLGGLHVPLNLSYSIVL